MVPGTQEVTSQIGNLQILYLLSYHAAMLAVYPKFHILHQGFVNAPIWNWRQNISLRQAHILQSKLRDFVSSYIFA